MSTIHIRIDKATGSLLNAPIKLLRGGLRPISMTILDSQVPGLLAAGSSLVFEIYLPSSLEQGGGGLQPKAGETYLAGGRISAWSTSGESYTASLDTSGDLSGNLLGLIELNTLYARIRHTEPGQPEVVGPFFHVIYGAAAAADFQQLRWEQIQNPPQFPTVTAATNITREADANLPGTGTVQAALDHIGTRLASGDADQQQLDANQQQLAADLASHEADQGNPHAVTKAQIGLASVDDTADTDKPVSTSQQVALDAKANRDMSNAENESVGLALLDAAVKALLNSINTGAGYIREGQWDASSGSYPVDTTGSMAAYTANRSAWYVSTAGTQDGVDYEVGDWIIWNGGVTNAVVDWDRDAVPTLNIPANFVGREMLSALVRSGLLSGGAEYVDGSLTDPGGDEYAYAILDGDDRPALLIDSAGKIHGRLHLTSPDGSVSITYDGPDTRLAAIVLDSSITFQKLAEAVQAKLLPDGCEFELKETVYDGHPAEFSVLDGNDRPGVLLDHSGKLHGRFQITSTDGLITVTYDGLETRMTVNQDLLSISPDLLPEEHDAYYGNGRKVLRAWTDQNFRPAIILYENGEIEFPQAIKEPDHAPQASYYDASRRGLFPATASRNIQVLGDSISTATLWPMHLGDKWDWPVLAYSLGSSNTEDFLRRMRAHELAPLVDGQPIRTRRYRQGRANQIWQANNWMGIGSLMDEIIAVEFYIDGELAEIAWEIEAYPATTDYANHPTRLIVPGHPWSVGDVVYPVKDGTVLPQNADRWDHDYVTNVFDGQNYNTLPGMPSRIIPYHTYEITSTGADWIEVKEVTGGATIDIGSEATVPFTLMGGFLGPNYTAGQTVEIKTRCERDDWTTIIAGGTNDVGLPNQNSGILANIDAMIESLRAHQKRVLILPPFTGSYTSRGPDSQTHIDYKKLYAEMPKRYGEWFVDVWSELLSRRPASELALQTDPEVDELVLLEGTTDSPTVKKRWSGFPSLPEEGVIDGGEDDGLRWSWIGPSFLPIKYRSSMIDLIHPNAEAYIVMADMIYTRLQSLNFDQE